MSFQEAHNKALKAAVDKLKGINLEPRLAGLGIRDKAHSGHVKLRVLGTDMALDLNTLEIFYTDSRRPIPAGDSIFILHYLQNEAPVTAADKLISFKNLPGGRLYAGPLALRTTQPLTAGIGNDLDRLKKNLTEFDWEPLDMPDFSAKIHVIGHIYIALIYYLGDDEFPPQADILYDECTAAAFVTEDAAYMAHRACFELKK